MRPMRLEELLDGLQVEAEPLALCVASRGWKLRLPAADQPTVHFVLDGSGSLQVEGRAAQPLATHALAVVPSGCVHVVQGDGRPAGEVTVMGDSAHGPGIARLTAGPDGGERVVLVCGALQACYAGGVGVFDLLQEPLVVDFSGSPEMQDTFHRLLAESDRDPPGSRAMIGALMQQCLVLLFRTLCDRPDCELPWLKGLDNPRLRDVIAAILARPDEPHSVASLASVAGMSRSAFARDFVHGLGCTPKAFVRQVRLQRAAELLRGTDLTVTVVARRTGFSSRSHFCRAFTTQFEQSPSGYRSTHRGRNPARVAG